MAQISDSASGAAAAPEEAVLPGVRRRRNPFAQAWWYLRRYPILPGIVIVGLILTGIFAPWVVPRDPAFNALNFREHPPTWGFGDEHNEAIDPSGFDLTTERGRFNYERTVEKETHGRFEFFLGGDQVGRDVLARVIQGARVSLKVSAIGLIAGTIVGVAMAVVAGYYGGWTDEVLMRLVDLWLGLPFLLIALVIAITLGTSENVVMLLLALLAWPPFVRQVRAEVLVIKTREYIQAAQIAGASDMRIIYKHLLPGVVGIIMVVASLRVGGLILAEAALSFLGAGIPDPIPAWGKSVSEGRAYLGTAWWISFWPGFAIFLVVMSMNFFGDWVRDRLDPRLRQVD